MCKKIGLESLFRFSFQISAGIDSVYVFALLSASGTLLACPCCPSVCPGELRCGAGHPGARAAAQKMSGHVLQSCLSLASQ